MKNKKKSENEQTRGIHDYQLPNSSCELLSFCQQRESVFESIFSSAADFVHWCFPLRGCTLQDILFISARGININVFVRPASEQQQRKKQPCHNAILPASSTAFTNRAARDQPATPPPLSVAYPPLPPLPLAELPKSGFCNCACTLRCERVSFHLPNSFLSQ